MTNLATILEVQRMSTEDGPGLRTTVFFKGCSLDCGWCHNPESIRSKPELQWHDWRCIGCRTCVEVCPEDALRLDAAGLRRDRARCQECGRCVDDCPASAQERLGRLVSVEELMGELLRDRAYYEASRGGVTLSGGEPALQADFAAALLDECRRRGLHSALDTCGQVAPSALRDLARRADLVLYDIKLIDDEEHRRTTGSGSAKILANFSRLVEELRTGAGAELWVRTPLIPGATATEKNISAIAELLATQAKDVLARWDLCAFNNLCRDKYRRLGLDWSFAEVPLLTASQLETFVEIGHAAGLDAEVVRTSGPLRLEAGRSASEPDTVPGRGMEVTC